MTSRRMFCGPAIYQRLDALTLLMLVALAGCNTAPTSPGEARAALSDRLLDFQDITPARNATIVVTRDQGFLGSGCYYAVSINGSLAARLNSGERAQFHVEPGEVLLKVGRDPFGRGLCGLDKDEWTQRETILRPGEVKQFRLLLMDNGKADIQRAD
jgi:hypothetical protein